LYGVVEQPSPTGMLDAIMAASPMVGGDQPDRVWVLWGDQVGVLAETMTRLAEAESREPAPALVFPTVESDDPYIHIVRDASGRIADVLQRREGDSMPPHGESDMGLFALSRHAYEQYLPAYAAQVQPARGTGERNFLPFVPWLASRDVVVTVPCSDPREARGINTPDDLRAAEEWLRTRRQPAS
jgi:bifunctional N-acetylglucosamine-1-phosphate-uridyltransferase/glucosamine-1-phosphate-acetyltransferase GlmU-like protein